ncbi:hypothetical protein Tsubulata_025529 [Turnera subulata]|uniref:Myb/SANT-like domain-containing protein n=1 Tax=Turnera subulata TaxID=218843 RepID=A0A9Q0FHW9_9ROSI|nr:hypothetical protein Tsubulata_025529 [Turnera subulata]
MADRRSWTVVEETTLVDILEELVNDGHRVDAGSFKPGTITLIVTQLAEKLPNSGLTVACVRSKMKRLKEKFSACNEMANFSGFAWNDVKKCVECDSREVITAYTKRNPKKTYKCGTSFPLFNRLAYVFGVDRANGALGELPDEADRALTEFTEGQGEGGAYSTFTAQPSNVGQGPNAEQSHTFPETVQTTSGSKKHKRSSDNLDGLAAAIVAGIECYSRYIDKLADAMHGKDPTWVLGDELHRLGLTPNESVQMAMRLFGNAGLTKFFWEMNDDQKREFIKTMMG